MRVSLIKVITVIFSFGMMGLFVAYRMGTFEQKKDIIESSAPGYPSESEDVINKFNAFTSSPEKHQKNQTLDLLPTSKSLIIAEPLLPITSENPKAINQANSMELSAEQLFIMSSSKSTFILDPLLILPNESPTLKVAQPFISADSIKKPN